MSLKLTNVNAPSATDQVAADKKQKYEHCAKHTTQKNIHTHTLKDVAGATGMVAKLKWTFACAEHIFC